MHNGDTMQGKQRCASSHLALRPLCFAINLPCALGCEGSGRKRGVVGSRSCSCSFFFPQYTNPTLVHRILLSKYPILLLRTRLFQSPRLSASYGHKLL